MTSSFDLEARAGTLGQAAFPARPESAVRPATKDPKGTRGLKGGLDCRAKRAEWAPKAWREAQERLGARASWASQGRWAE